MRAGGQESTRVGGQTPSRAKPCTTPQEHHRHLHSLLLLLEHTPHIGMLDVVEVWHPAIEIESGKAVQYMFIDIRESD
jgi:hypothetical protein